MKRHEADHIPHVFQPRVHPFWSGPKTFSDKMVMLVVVKGHMLFTASLHEASASE